MGKELRAENLTIAVPYNKKCNRDCPYCISKMTGYMEHNFDLMVRNAIKVKQLAKTAGITSILFTGKGEPTLNLEHLSILAELFFEYPMEVQTNALTLMVDTKDMLYKLWAMGINTIAISTDSDGMFDQIEKIIELADKEGLDFVWRITINVSDRFKKYNTYDKIATWCSDHGVNQLSLRKLSVPLTNRTSNSDEVVEWIEKHAPYGLYEKLTDELYEAVRVRGIEIRTLNHGEVVYDLDGVSVVAIDYCIQEKAERDNIRSLIFQEDGHLYTTWNSKASIIF